MPGERQFAVGSEDAHRVSIVAPVRDECRLRETDLARNIVHLIASQVAGIGDDAQLVPGEFSLGEHVDEPQGNPHVSEYDMRKDVAALCRNSATPLVIVHVDSSNRVVILAPSRPSPDRDGLVAYIPPGS